ncbi:MAG: DNA translocase FtsK 4TM domain-containing protein [Halanaerobiales bacterium]
MPKTASKNNKKQKQNNINDVLIEKRKNEIIGILLIALAILSAIALYTDTAGYVGRKLSGIYHYIIGDGSFVFPVLFLLWGITLVRLKGLRINSRLVGFILAYICIMTIIHTYQYSAFPTEAAFLGQGGGLIGGGISYLFMGLFGYIGSFVILGAIVLIGLLLGFDVHLISILKNIKDYFVSIINRIKMFFEKRSAARREKKKAGCSGEKESAEKVDRLSDNSYKQYEESALFTDNELARSTDNQDDISIDEFFAEDFVEDKSVETASFNTKSGKPSKTVSNVSVVKDENKDKAREENNIDYEDYLLPSIKLLKDTRLSRDKPGNKSNILEETLQSFGVKAKVLKVNHGPTITRYEVQPASGVKVSKIVSLADDIALALAAPGVRIEAPIPGKAAVGVEVPHMKDITVRLRDIISSSEFSDTDGKLLLALGMGIDGKPIVTNLAKMPHLLVAGATGSGKSVCVNTIITSILYNATPDEVKLLLIDPKKVELSVYQGLPHLFAPVVTDPKKAASVLKLVVDEMESRYELFSGSGTRGIESYNKKMDKEEQLPYIVVIIDELSDLMMVSASDVEDNICRLAQMARAAGIHLVIATQRPSVDVITGLIKANIPSRISFAVSSQTDSRTILDMGGAEKLLGKGDMLLAPAGTQKPQRVQGAFIDNDEITRIVDFVKNQANPDYIFDLEDINEVKIEMESDDERDELYKEAVKLVVNYRASISMLQRRLHVGHSRAARMIDMMEEDGIVGPYAGSKAREVLITPDELEDYLNANNTKDNNNFEENEEIQ